MADFSLSNLGLYRRDRRSNQRMERMEQVAGSIP